MKNSRNSPEKRTAIDAGWNLLTGGLERRIAGLETLSASQAVTMGKQAEQINHQAMQITELNTKLATALASLARLQVLNEWLTRRVAQLVAYIVSKNLTPPREEPPPWEDKAPSEMTARH